VRYYTKSKKKASAKQKTEIPKNFCNKRCEKFSFTKCSSHRYFYQVLWQFLRTRRSRSNFGGLLVAAEGGEMSSNYFQNRTPVRKSQILLVRLAPLGDQIIRNFRRKFELAVFRFGKRKFLYETHRVSFFVFDIDFLSLCC
jgi:hypothetical protein